MASLVLGPILRHVEAAAATVWVETDGPCEVTVLGSSARTFQVEGHHYALVELTGLDPDVAYEYTVGLDGREVWPEPDSPFPRSVVRALDAAREISVVFGSCRVSLPHEPPYVLHQADHEEAQGVDALRALALRMVRSDRGEWPDCLLMLGDQIYADDLSPSMLEVTRSRDGDRDAPVAELDGFEDYTLAYREAWSEPAIRWLLSTVPTAMIFDDHEIKAQWKISQAWMEEMWAKPWYEERIVDGLMAYWVYQHLGNLSLDELRETEVLDEIRRADEAGPVLREHMRNAHRQAGHSRWSYRRDLGRARLLVIDSRAGRELEPGRRSMVTDTEWDWIAEQATGDLDHLLLASSVPFFLTHGLHHLEAWDEAIADGAWGTLGARAGEWLRQTGVMDHWASFHASFRRLCRLLEEVATGERGSPPDSIVMLSGDVHHCYLAEVGFARGTGASSSVWQAVCSAYRKDLAPREKRAMRIGNSRNAARVARALARAAGVEDPSVGWRLVHDPCYDNQIGTLELGPGTARVQVETTAGCDWRDPRLATVFERQLVGEPDRGEARSTDAIAGRIEDALELRPKPAEESSAKQGLDRVEPAVDRAPA